MDLVLVLDGEMRLILEQVARVVAAGHRLKSSLFRACLSVSLA
jgi:hypothetical protein